MESKVISKKEKPYTAFCRAKCAIGNKKGFSYILTCVCILVVMMLVSAAMQYAFIYHVARTQQNETQLKLDSYVTRYAVSKYDALKQGERWEDYIDCDDLVDGAYTLLGFHRVITPGYQDTAVYEKYAMSRPSIHALDGGAFGVLVEYEITIPFELFNTAVAEITVPITIVSQFKQK